MTARTQQSRGRTKVAQESVGAAFAEKFGEDQANAITEAALGHANGVNSDNKGIDPFKWALLVTIGYQCFEIDSYREYHGITAPYEDIKAWVIENADLASHDGDCDYISAFCGVYDEYVGVAGEAA